MPANSAIIAVRYQVPTLTMATAKEQQPIRAAPTNGQQTKSPTKPKTHLVASVRREKHRVALGGLRRGEVGDREVTASDSRVAVDALQHGLDRGQAGALGRHGERLVLSASVLGVTDGHTRDDGVDRLLVLGLLE